MDMTKRIEIAARLLANMMPELLSATNEARAKMGRQALDWVDALEEVATGDVTVVKVNTVPSFASQFSSAVKRRDNPEMPWAPNKPTLCWVWDEDDKSDLDHDRPQVIVGTVPHEFQYRTSNHNYWRYAQPLTRAEVLALVDEPSRYPWDRAPEWAMWAATDWDGSASWYEAKPKTDDENDCWICGMGEGRLWEEGHRFKRKGNVSCAAWRETLEPRPRA